MARESARKSARRARAPQRVTERSGKKSQLQVNVEVTGEGKAPALSAYLFSASGEAIASGPVQNGRANLAVPAELNGRRLQLFVAPRPSEEQGTPAAASLRRLGAVERGIRFLEDKPAIDLTIPIEIIPPFCLCYVHGRLVKRVLLPDGTISEQAVCNARVHICEVDRIPLIIEKLPDPDIFRLRDDLLEILTRRVPPVPPPEPFPPEPFPGPIPPGPGPVPPGPGPDPARMAMRSMSPAMRMASRGGAMAGEAAMARASMAEAAGAGAEGAMLALRTVSSAAELRRQLTGLAELIKIHLCELRWIWWLFDVDCLWTVEADEHGRFGRWIVHRCNDQPDLYFWVEQQQAGAWVTVYHPSVACHTYWNYDCATEITINIPNAIGCDDPPYDVPPGVTLFVLPYAIGSTPIWGRPAGSPPAPTGWVRTDGLTNYVTSGLGQLNDAPFGATLSIIQDDSYFIPSSGIKYYRYSFRRAGGSGDWTPIATPLGRGYRMEYSDRLPTYESYPVGPFTVGAQSNLFEFKPQTPPARPTDPATVVAREWTSGNLSEAAAVWNTVGAAPGVDEADPDQAGQFEVRVEVFSPTGVRVAPGPATFRFLALNADMTTTRLAEPGVSAVDPMEVFDDSFHFFMHLDNNGVTADLPQPSIQGVGADPNCGFLFYDPTDPADDVLIQFHADHRNDRAVFGFGIVRGSNGLPNASTPPAGSVPNYVEVAAAVAPLAPGPGYALAADYYQRTFEPSELVGPCVNAAFAASLGVYGKATNGWWRIGYDAYRLIAFALAAQVEEEEAPEPAPEGPGG